MKKIKSCITLIIVCTLFMANTTFASARASEQISFYMMDVTSTGNGRIAIMFSITGTNFMDRIGAQSIYVLERKAYGWDIAESWDADDPGMIEENAAKHGNTIYFNGESGKEYRIVVTVFAEDEYGESDSRSKTFNITAE